MFLKIMGKALVYFGIAAGFIIFLSMMDHVGFQHSTVSAVVHGGARSFSEVVSAVSVMVMSAVFGIIVGSVTSVFFIIPGSFLVYLGKHFKGV